MKGHATQKHIDEGLTTAEGAEGNGKADTLAGLGINEHMDGLQHLANYYRAKQHKLQQLTTRIHNMITRVLTKEHELRTEINTKEEAQRKLAQGTKKPTTTLPSKHDAPPPDEGHQLALDDLTTDETESHDTKRRCQVKAFLHKFRWKPTTQGHNGTSWLELLALYTTMGGTAEAKPPTTELTLQTSLRQQLATFTNDVKTLTTTLLQPHDQILFRAAKDKQK